MTFTGPTGLGVSREFHSFHHQFLSGFPSIQASPVPATGDQLVIDLFAVPKEGKTLQVKPRPAGGQAAVTLYFKGEVYEAVSGEVHFWENEDRCACTSGTLKVTVQGAHVQGEAQLEASFFRLRIRDH